jgi:CRP/FNR family cyclic AMP-dependent transcriptional regulator
MTQLLELDGARRFLKQCGWLANTPASFADALLSQCSLDAVQRGDCVYQLGDPPDGLYGVISGALRFEIAPHERGPNITHIMSPGFWFGEGELFDGRPRIGSFIATRPSAYLHISQRAFMELAGEKPEAWRWIGLLASQHLFLALAIIDDASIRDPGARISALLLRLADVRDKGQPRDPFPQIDITQSDISLLTAVSRATVVAHLQKLEKSGLIARSYRSLTLLNPEGLRDRVARECSADRDEVN